MSKVAAVVVVVVVAAEALASVWAVGALCAFGALGPLAGRSLRPCHLIMSPRARKKTTAEFLLFPAMDLYPDQRCKMLVLRMHRLVLDRFFSSC